MNRPKPTLAAIWLALPVVLTLLLVWTNTQFPLDFWLHVQSGKWMWEHQQLVTVDTFTHTIAGQPVRNQPWLAQLLMFQLYRAGGYALAQGVLGAIYGAAVGLVGLLTYRRCRDSRVTAAALVVAVAVAGTNMAIRPQAFSVLLFAAELYVLYTWPSRHFTPWVVALIELLWTNLHGAFPLGVVLPGVFLVGGLVQRVAQRVPAAGVGAVRTSLLCCVLAGTAMFINPQGAATMRYVSGVASKATQRHVEEWLPTSMDSAVGTAFMLSVAGTLALLCASRRRTSPTDTLLLAAFFLAGVTSQRMVIWWALVWPVILAPHVGAWCARWRWVAPRVWSVARDALARRLARDPRGYASRLARRAACMVRLEGPRGEQSRLLNGVAASCLCALLLCSTPWTRMYNPLLPAGKRVAIPRDEPLGAVEFLASGDHQGRMYQPMEWGSYVSCQLDPRVKVFVDSRIDFFPDRVWADYVAIGTRPDRALDLLERYGVNLVLWDPRLSRGLPALLESSPDWQRVYRDQTSVLFVRHPDRSAQVGPPRRSTSWRPTPR